MFDFTTRSDSLKQNKWRNKKFFCRISTPVSGFISVTTLYFEAYFSKAIVDVELMVSCITKYFNLGHDQLVFQLEKIQLVTNSVSDDSVSDGFQLVNIQLVIYQLVIYQLVIYQLAIYQLAIYRTITKWLITKSHVTNWYITNSTPIFINYNLC